MITPELVERIQHRYDIIKLGVSHLSGVDYAPANLIVDEIGSDSRYGANTDELIISMPEDYDESEFKDDEKKWQSWKIELIHEMIHEYQYKMNPSVSPMGAELFSKFQIDEFTPKPGGFPGKGHNEVFYTCVDIFAHFFGVSGNDLVVGALIRI